ncbi:MAG: sigma-70 family RNA polymerase sigma factor [Lentisphaerae bacterium]|nr:sigma-70 family RNA polymerase sigma factor [Lentisphaerota bacterium]
MAKAAKELKEKRLRAFETVVSEYERALIRYATRVTRNANAAQDIVQETMIRLLRSWRDELKPSPQLSSWLYRVAHNCAVDHMRRESRRHLLHKRHAEESDLIAAPNRGRGARVSDEAEQAAAALQKLSLRERQLVILKVYEDKTYREISEITALSVGNVGYILHHAMKKLAAELKKAKAI